MKLRRDYAQERQKTANEIEHVAQIFIRALVRVGCVVKKDSVSYSVKCPQGCEFSFYIVQIGRRGGMLAKVFSKERAKFSNEKPFFSWASHVTRPGTNPITAKRASILLAKKIRMNPLYSVMET